MTRFVCSVPALRITLPTRRYCFRRGVLELENERDIAALRQTPWYGTRILEQFLEQFLEARGPTTGPGFPVECASCRHTFTARRREAKTCSPRCRQRWARANRLDMRALWGECPVCHFKFSRLRVSGVFCSKRCRQWRWRREQSVRRFCVRHGGPL